MPFFLSLHKISKNQLEPSLIGGKAKALAQLYQNNFLVPNGFVITTEFFNLFSKEDNISENDLAIPNPIVKTVFPQFHRTKFVDLCQILLK